MAKKKKKKQSTKTAAQTETTRRPEEVSPELPGSRLPWWAAAAIVTAAAVIPFLNIFGNGFVNYDDDKFILGNKIIRTLDAQSVRDIFLSYLPGRPHYADFPLTHLTWAINYRLGGYNPWGYHFGNLALHAAACLLLFALLSRGPWRRGVAFWASLLFATHPIHVEAVTWMMGRKEVLSGALIFAAALIFSYFVRDENKARGAAAWVAAFVLWVAAIFAKSTAIAAPVLMAVWVVFAEPRQRMSRGLKGLAVYAPFILAFFWIQITVSAERKVITHYIGGSLVTSQLANGYILLSYLRFLAAPFGLSAHYPFDDNPHAALYLCSWIAVLIAAAALAFFAKKRPGILFYPLWFLVGLVPTLQLVPTRIPMADRYLYVPSVAFCLAVAAVAAAAAEKFRQKHSHAVIAATIILAVLAAGYGAASLTRNRVWHDSESLWTDTYRKYPNSAPALNNLGLMHFDRGEFNDAEAMFLKSIKIKSDDYIPYLNLGVLYLRHGDPRQGLKYLQDGIKLDSTDPVLNQNLAVAYLVTGDPRKAAETAGHVLAIQPDNTAAPLILCEAYKKTGTVELVKKYCPAGGAVQANPMNPDEYWRTARNLFAAGKIKDAMAIYKHFTQTNPNLDPAWVNLGLCQYADGDFAGAETAWRKTLEINPDNDKAKAFLDALKMKRPIPIFSKPGSTEQR